jgi:(p)ppGpp synthase/HD superfamily hydrolase
VLVDYARYFAIAAHGQQKRKYTGDPYWFHLRNVVNTLSKYYVDFDAYIVGWLHDVVEDTPMTCFDVAEHFNDSIAQHVSDLTEPYNPKKNRAWRKAYYNEILINSCELVQTVKYADMLDNTESIEMHDPDFAKIYLKEKRELLKHMDKGNKELYNLVCLQCRM